MDGYDKFVYVHLSLLRFLARVFFNLGTISIVGWRYLGVRKPPRIRVCSLLPTG